MEVEQAEILLLLQPRAAFGDFVAIFRDVESEVLQVLQCQCVCHLAFRLGITALPTIPLLGIF